MSDPVNPYIAGNPVTGEEMFFGRENVFAFVRQALTGQHRDNVIVLYGQRRTGKTSALYQMHRHLDSRYLCIFVDLHGLAINGVDGFLWDIANTIVRALRKEHQIELPPLKRAEFLQDGRAAFENEFLPQVWNAIGDQHILLMLDEAIRLQEQIAAGKLDKSVFEYLRHLMQHSDRLNFLFALGSGLEEMEKEYAFLFSVGLYRKISFLTLEAATALITQPVKEYYKLEPSTVDRIFSVTSGHPYFTQLLCHGLFNRWLQLRRPLLRSDDVNALLDEVVERGLAVLKQVWDDSTPGEKALLAGLSTAMGKRSHPIGLAEVDRVWGALDVVLPDNEKAKAVRSLVARDVIIGEDKYHFAVELQRLWIQKYAKLEWVKEEITPALQKWQLPPEKIIEQKQLKRNRSDLATFAIILGCFVALIILLFQSMRSLNENVVAERIQRRTLEAQLSRLVAAQATGTVAAVAPAATATSGAAQLYALQLTTTALAPQCTLPVSAADDLIDRLNTLRTENGVAAVPRDSRLSAQALLSSNNEASGAAQPFDLDSVMYQGCRLDDLWQGLSSDPSVRRLLLSPNYVSVGIGLVPGTLNTVVLTFGLPEPKPTSTPTPTLTPTATRRPPRPTATQTITAVPYLGPLDFDWVIETQGQNPANPGQWRAVIRIDAQGGDGRYQYFHDGLPVTGPRFEVVYRVCRDKPGSFWVQDGSGRIAKQTYYLSSAYCPDGPRP
jgi:hypothetical protein